MNMHDRFRLSIFFFTPLLWTAFAAPCFATITFENRTSATISIYLRGDQEENFRGPFPLYAHTEMPIELPAGRYRVVARRNEGDEDMGWKDYRNEKVTYSVAQCAPCNPGGTAVDVPRTQVFHPDGTYLCPKCGQWHVRWAAGWGNGEDRQAQYPEFNPEGTYRLGVSVVDSAGGAMVTNAIAGSPAERMRRVDSEDGINYALSPGINVITHVNGQRIYTGAQFAAAVGESPQRLTVRVYNTERQSTRSYETVLRY
jgi:hypothetical protein